MSSVMERVSVNGVELEFACVGASEPVVFIHGAGIADTGLPLAAEPALSEHYRMIRYRRRGYAGCTRIQGAVSIADHAQDCLALLSALEVEQAHVVSHSYSAVVAVRLAVDAPEVVSSLALFDPTPLVVMDPEQFDEAVRPIMRPIMDDYLAGDPVAAVDGIFCLPILAEVRDLLHAYLPQTEDDVMPGANHLLHLRHPADAAARLAGFLKHHPIAAE